MTQSSKRRRGLCFLASAYAKSSLVTLLSEVSILPRTLSYAELRKLVIGSNVRHLTGESMAETGRCFCDWKDE